MQSIDEYNPADVGVRNGNLYGIPRSWEDSPVVVIPVPWDVTVSYGAGTAKAPAAVLDASVQLDLAVPGVKDAWRYAPGMLPIDEDLQKAGEKARKLAERHIKQLESGEDLTNRDLLRLEKINEACGKMNQWVEQHTKMVLRAGKIPAVLGGDHSTSYGLIKSLSEEFNFGILHIDAHMDLRHQYEGFSWSHASIMENVLNRTEVQKLVQVGIRDFAESEHERTQKDRRISVTTWNEISDKLNGRTGWPQIAKKIIKELPERVYISLDVDGLDPSLCPGTGTPVPGGLSWDQVRLLLKALDDSGKQIVGFDLVETAPSDTEWDANIAARLLFMLSLTATAII